MPFAILARRPMSVGEQMAHDEELLDDAASGGRPDPVIRRYAWPGGDDLWATIGYFQKPDIVPGDLRERWARRPTGGGLVLHAGVLTWSLVFSEGGQEAAPTQQRRTAREVYRAVHGALRVALAACGVEATLAPATASGRGGVCAVTLGPYDLLVVGRKVAGGAQRRRGGAVLYQGYVDLQALGLPSDRLWEELVKAVGVIA